jgi:hypothetical protein
MYRYLQEHPDIFMSPSKEPHYFTLGDMELSKEAEALWAHLPHSLHSYKKLFKGVGQEKAIGEASTSYLDTERAAQRIARIVPHAKLIAVLRDPTDRACSHFTFNLKVFYEELPTFHEAMAAEPQRLSLGLGPRFKYIGKGLYFKQVKNYFSLFSRDQICVLLYDDFKSDPRKFIQDLLHFLEVDDTFMPDMSVKYNVSGLYRNKSLEIIMRTFHPLRLVLERKLPPKFVSFLGKNLMKRNEPGIELRRKLVAIYRDDILKLQDLIHRDLSHWLD